MYIAVKIMITFDFFVQCFEGFRSKVIRNSEELDRRL